MDAEEPRRRSRGAIYQGDPVAVLAELPASSVMGFLQVGGDGLLLALDHDIPGATEVARTWVERLRERDWIGDHELAEQIEGRSETRAAHRLEPLPIALDELSEVLEGDPLHGGGEIDLRTGQVWSRFALDDGIGIDDDDDDDRDDERRLTVHCEGSRNGYQDMVDFVETITDPERRDRLEITLRGRGAFRRFKDVLARWPAEFTRWHGFSEERRCGRARAWLADAGYRTVRASDAPPG